MRFCMNKSDCRRTQVLAFFNETFDPVNCHAECDVCLSRDQTVYEQEDVTASAVSVIKMMQGLDRKDRVTVVSATEIWRGANKASVRQYSGNDYYGAGDDWDRSDAERLLQYMLVEKALAEFTVHNKAGWSNSYLKVS
jgi:bloom syndrome protein